MNGADLLLMVGVVAGVWFAFRWLQPDRETQRRQHHGEPTSIRELVDQGKADVYVYDQDGDVVPLEWLDQLDALKRLPETGRGL